MHVQFSGRYRLQVFHGDTDILLKDTGWFDNHITNIGMDMIGSSVGRVCHVGSVASAAETDTAMGALLASSTSMSARTTGQQVTTAPYYGWEQLAFTFGIGAVQGTIAEVGLGSTATNLFSHALLKGINGTPTTLTLSGIDRLVLTYEFRQYIDTADHTYTIDIDGVSVSSLTRPGYVGIGQIWAPDLSIGIGAYSASVAAYHNGSAPYVGALTSLPSGTANSGTTTFYAYTPGAHSRDWYCVLAASLGNKSFTAVSLYSNAIAGAGLGGYWQFSLEPAVVKSQYQNFRIEGRMSWSRYP